MTPLARASTLGGWVTLQLFGFAVLRNLTLCFNILSLCWLEGLSNFSCELDQPVESYTKNEGGIDKMCPLQRLLKQSPAPRLETGTNQAGKGVGGHQHVSPSFFH